MNEISNDIIQSSTSSIEQKVEISNSLLYLLCSVKQDIMFLKYDF